MLIKHIQKDDFTYAFKVRCELHPVPIFAFYSIDARFAICATFGSECKVCPNLLTNTDVYHPCD